MTVSGWREVDAALRAMTTRAQTAARDSVLAAAAKVEAAAKEEFTGSHRKGQPHQGPVGGPPNVVTGALRRSIGVHDQGPIPFGYQAKVYPTLVYSRAIELGLRQAPDIAYPYLRPGFEKVRPSIEDEFRSRWLRSLGG